MGFIPIVVQKLWFSECRHGRNRDRGIFQYYSTHNNCSKSRPQGRKCRFRTSTHSNELWILTFVFWLMKKWNLKKNFLKRVIIFITIWPWDNFTKWKFGNSRNCDKNEQISWSSSWFLVGYSIYNVLKQEWGSLIVKPSKLMDFSVIFWFFCFSVFSRFKVANYLYWDIIKKILWITVALVSFRKVVWNQAMDFSIVHTL